MWSSFVLLHFIYYLLIESRYIGSIVNVIGIFEQTSKMLIKLNVTFKTNPTLLKALVAATRVKMRAKHRFSL